MKRIRIQALAVLTGALLLLSCQETVPNIGTQPDPRDRGTVKNLVVVQHVPKRGKTQLAKFGFQMEGPAGSAIKQTPIGYLVTNGKVTMEVAQAELFPHDPAFSKVGFFKLVQIKNGFAAKFKILDTNYRFLCIGAVDQAVCNRVMKSIQIIRR